MTVSGDSNTIPFPGVYRDGDTLGGRIWRARDALDMSLGDVAARLGLPEETVSDWERDHAEPRTQSLFMLAGVLGVSPSWLIAGIGDAPDEDAHEDGADPLAKALQEVQRLHAETGLAIARLERRIARMSRDGGR